MAIVHIITDLTDDLFYQFADSLPSVQLSVDPALYNPLVRFFAHLVLFQRLVGKNPPLGPARDILQAYLECLEREGKGELVAVYAGSLGERRGEESYARFLRGAFRASLCLPTPEGRLTLNRLLQTWTPTPARRSDVLPSSAQRSMVWTS